MIEYITVNIMQINENLILQSGDIKLSPITEADQCALVNIAQDPRIWQYNPSFTDPDDFIEKWFNKALEHKKQGSRYPFIIRYQDKPIGSSSFYDIDNDSNTVTIGYTWLHPNYWGKGINTSVKHLLLDYAFNVCKVREVYFVIDVLNLRSRAAVIKLGAKEKEIYRNHLKRPDGTMRDSVVYVMHSFSILNI
ncbi:MAG: GNAT family N-acetyltransferase [Gammaproteobacteria bacterium]|jgi:RimJ/RimL family protein N-acetyltransferase